MEILVQREQHVWDENQQLEHFKPRRVSRSPPVRHIAVVLVLYIVILTRKKPQPYSIFVCTFFYVPTQLPPFRSIVLIIAFVLFLRGASCCFSPFVVDMGSHRFWRYR